MKIALVHDWFNVKFGGAERVALAFAALFPDAPIYTLFFDYERFGAYVDKKRIHTSFLQYSPKWLKRHPRYWLPLLPLAVRSLRLSEYDLILSSSFGYVKNLHHRRGSMHICYCHTPLRAVWDYREQYMDEQPIGGLQRLVGKYIASYINRWDLAGSRRVNVWLANSKTVAGRIKAFYAREAKVIYPPVDTRSYVLVAKKGSFYLTASMLAPYKKVDMVIEAFNQSGRQLKVMGEGPLFKRLKQLSKANIELLGYVSESEKRKLMSQAKALIYPNQEAFGIAPVEAMAAGTPVIAFNAGGVTETVIEGKTGLFFDDQSPSGLNTVITKFERLRLSPNDMVKRARHFDASQFEKAILSAVEEASRHVHPN